MAAGGMARRRPTCSAIMVPWLNPTSASADGGSLRRCSSASRNASSAGAAALTPIQRSFGSRNVSGNHSRPLRGLSARARRVRRHERGVRQQALPGAADLDQVVAVGAIAVQEHHELPRGAGARLDAAWAIEFSHFHVSFWFSWRSAFSLPAEPGPRRAFSPRDNKPIADAPPRRARAARPRRFCKPLGVRPLAQIKRDAGGFLHREVAGSETHRRGRGRTADKYRRSTARRRAAR